MYGLKTEKVEMLSNDVFVWAGYDITQIIYIEDCIGARVVSNDLLFTEICRHKGRRHDDKNHNIFENYENVRKSAKINEKRTKWIKRLRNR